jgi:ADP-ribose diphosphatase
MNRLPTILSSSWSTRTQKLETLALEFSNGEKRSYHRVHPTGHGAVMVVALQDAQTLLLTREYCCGFHRYELGIVRGRIDDGETPLQAAHRELQEEIGFGAKRLDYLRTLSLAPTYMAHEIHLILARDLFPSRLEGDEPEPIEVVPYAFADFDALALHPEFTEGRALAAILAARAFIAREAA